MHSLAFVFLSLAIASGPVFAATKKASVDVSGSFADQKKAIEADLADGETYAEINPPDRAAVQEALQRIGTQLNLAGGSDKLSDAEKASVFNDQELINNILTRAGEDSRLICTREKKVGSHRTTTRCMTVGERRRAADDSEKALRENQRFMCGDSGCLSRPGG